MYLQAWVRPWRACDSISLYGYRSVSNNTVYFYSANTLVSSILERPTDLSMYPLPLHLTKLSILYQTPLHCFTRYLFSLHD
jgi:hypothetical protein